MVLSKPKTYIWYAHAPMGENTLMKIVPNRNKWTQDQPFTSSMTRAGEDALELASDFGFLPDIVWVKVMAYLDLPTRNKASRTCHALHAAFHHPSLWHTVKITLLGDMSQMSLLRRRGFSVIMPDRYLEMVKRFGTYFQDLTLTVMGFVGHFPPRSQMVINELSQRCRLQRLTLDVGVMLTKTSLYDAGAPRKVHLDVLVGLVANAFRLKSFYLKAWPLYRGIENVDVLEALKANTKLRELERLDLFWQSAESSSWATLNAILPSTDTMLDMVRHFMNLESLALRSTMLREDIIVELSKPCHTPLKRLAVLVTYSRAHNEGVPEISSAAWSSLREHCPELEVEFTIVTRMPFIELSGFLKTEIPVSALGFMKYSSLHVEDLVSIRDKYSHTLRKFVSLVEVDDLDESLKSLVAKSPRLTSLVYYGSLYHQTILDLAGIRGGDWYRFDMPEKSIYFTILTDEIGEEVVVVRTADGQVVLADSLRHASQQVEIPREEQLQTLIEQVSKIMQQKWHPLDMPEMERALAQGAASEVVSEKALRAAQAATNEQHDTS